MHTCTSRVYTFAHMCTSHVYVHTFAHMYTIHTHTGVKSLQSYCLSVIVEAANSRRIQTAEELCSLLPTSVPKMDIDRIKAAFAAEQKCATETPRFLK